MRFKAKSKWHAKFIEESTGMINCLAKAPSLITTTIIHFYSALLTNNCFLGEQLTLVFVLRNDGILDFEEDFNMNTTLRIGAWVVLIVFFTTSGSAKKRGQSV